jgi:hypothetical protein
MSEELRVIEQIYDLILWSHQHISKFPKTSKYSIGCKLESTLLSILNSLIAAKYSKPERNTILFQTGVQLEEVRMLYRLSKDLRLINMTSHEYAARTITEITKQVQGWRKSLSQVKASDET